LFDFLVIVICFIVSNFDIRICGVRLENIPDLILNLGKQFIL